MCVLKGAKAFCVLCWRLFLFAPLCPHSHTQQTHNENNTRPSRSNAALVAAASSRDAAIVTADAVGIIQSANRAAERMFGYAKGELDGKSVGALMPPPHSSRHAGYMRAFASTGEARVLDRTCEVVAMHRDRTMFPVCLTVGRASGEGADATFIGVMRPAPPTASDEVKAWVTMDGTVLCVDQGERGGWRGRAGGFGGRRKEYCGVWSVRRCVLSARPSQHDHSQSLLLSLPSLACCKSHSVHRLHGLVAA